MNKQFWSDKSVLITGNTGFKGSWLTLCLKRLGARIIGYSLSPPTHPSLFHLADVHQGIHMVQGDVRDMDYLLQIFFQHRPQIVIHMAAQSLVRDSYMQPVETCETNIMGTVHVLEAIRRTPEVRAAVFVTSDKCYENQETRHGYKETDPMGGHDLYSCSKGCDELLISAYRRSFFSEHSLAPHDAALASVRAGNVIGGGDWARDRLVVDVMKALMSGGSLTLRNPDAVRPWQHVLDPLQGYILLAEKLWECKKAYSSAWNFGPEPGDAKPVKWIAEQLQQIWSNNGGAPLNWRAQSKEYSPHEAGFLYLDAGKAYRELGWHPKLNIQQSLEWTVQWYRAYQCKADMHDATMRQINLYHQLNSVCHLPQSGTQHPHEELCLRAMPVRHVDEP